MNVHVQKTNAFLAERKAAEFPYRDVVAARPNARRDQ